MGGRSVATGAGRGIGRAVALGAAAEGARVVVNDYGVSIEGAEPTSSIADAVVKEIEAAGGEAVAVADDISTMAGGQRVVDAALTSYGRIDGVVCVAGILRERMLFDMSEEEWDPVVATDPNGTFTVFRRPRRSCANRVRARWSASPAATTRARSRRPTTARRRAGSSRWSAARHWACTSTG